MSKPYPLKCQPVLKAKLWGGERLSRRFGHHQARESSNIGEAWLVADLPEGASAIANGPLAGQPLAAAVAEWGRELLGAAWPDAPFPLLIKILDAAADLSVQVHPSNEDCKRHFPGDHGKEEFWIILDSAHGSVHHGFCEGVASAEFERGLAEGRLEQCLREFPVKVGDVLHLAPGTVHSIRQGVVLLEIQQPSDSTFRVYDYQRRDEHGALRPLHLEQARKALNFTPAPSPLIASQPESCSFGTRELLIDIPAFRIERARLEGSLTWRVDPRSVQVLVLVQGAATLHSEAGELAVSAWDAVVLPAAIGTVALAPQETTAIVLAGAGGAPLIDI